MADCENNILEDKSRKNAIAETLSSIDFKRLEKLAECDGDFKAVLKLADFCLKILENF